MTEPEDWRASAYYQALAATALSGSQDYDRAILTLSSGTLALSATFIHNIADHPMSNVDLLSWSWAGLIAAIVSIVVSFQTSQWATRRDMLGKTAPLLVKVTVGLNLLGGLAFIGGIVLFARFAFVNL